MEDQNYPTTDVARICSMIELLYPCMDDYLYVYDLKNDYYYISPSAVKRFLLPAYQFNHVPETHNQFVYPEDIPLLQKDLAEVADGQKDSHNLHYRWLGRDGQPLWINCRGRIVRDADGIPSYMAGCINETGATQKADNVSGLLGESSLRTVIQALNARSPKGFILRLGIDDFRDINENLGIEYGDRILRETAGCISSCVQTGQQLFRIVADEFIVLDMGGGNVDEAYRLFKDIRHAIDRFIESNCYEAVYTISGGVIPFSADSSYSDMMKLSEFSLNEAKRCGKNRCYTFSEEDYNHFLRRKKIIRALRHSVHHNFEGFEVFFQPVVHSFARTLRGAEALLRFSSPETGPLSPAEFIPLLEETSLIVPVGRWVLQQALSACEKWRRTLPDFSVSVNLSTVQVLKDGILGEILNGVREHNLPPSALIIELTESGYLESNVHFTKLWSRLKEAGIILALDDFGTGYSNLHYLSDLNPNIIKIDRSFTIKALKNSYERELLIHIIRMVHSIGLSLCIEGIETIEELQTVEQYGPDYIQGYYFGRPCPYAEFERSFIDPGTSPTVSGQSHPAPCSPR